MDDILFKPLNLGGNAITLKHRVVLAPLTRNRGSEPDLCPTKLNEDYYSQRASDGGLIILSYSYMKHSSHTMTELTNLGSGSE